MYIQSETLCLCVDTDVKLKTEELVIEDERQDSIASLQGTILLEGELTALDGKLLINFGVKDLDSHFICFAEQIEGHLL